MAGIKDVWIQRAESSIRSFLGSSSWEAATEHLLGAGPEAPRAFVRGPLNALAESDLFFVEAKPRDSNDSYITTHFLETQAEPPRLYFIVEEVGGEAKIHWKAIEQQLLQELGEFADTLGGKPLDRCYAILSEFRGQPRQEELAGFAHFVLSSPFSGGGTADLLVALPEESGDATRLRSRLATANQIDLELALKWEKTNGGHPYPTITQIFPSNWGPL